MTGMVKRESLMLRSGRIGSILLALVVVAPGLGAVARQQAPAQAPAPPPAAAAKDDDEGVPITNETVKTVCGTCHKADAKGRLSRISFRRTTPEGWQETIRRMVTLNKADIDPDQARTIVKYLSDRLGLAPEESKPATFEVERRLIDFKYTANADTERVCSSCHSIGRVMLQRRTDKEWDLVVAMHRGYYPLVDFQVFRRGGPPSTEPGPDGRPPDNRHPMDKALGHLKSAFPLTTPEWSAWAATMRSPRIDGTWFLRGYEPGQGAVFGTVTITATPASPDAFTTETTYRYAKSGRTVTRRGTRARLHRLPVARPDDGRSGREDVAARSDGGRARLAVDVRALVRRRPRRVRTGRAAEPAGTGDAGRRRRPRLAEAIDDRSDAPHLRRELPGHRGRPRRRPRPGRVGDAGGEHDADDGDGRAGRRGRRAGRRARPLRRRRRQTGGARRLRQGRLRSR